MRRSGRTLEPCCEAEDPRCCRSADCNRCVAVWFLMHDTRSVWKGNDSMFQSQLFGLGILNIITLIISKVQILKNPLVLYEDQDGRWRRVQKSNIFYRQLYTHTHTRTHASTHARTHTHTHTCTRAHTHTHTRTRTHTHAHTHTPIHTHTQLDACTHPYAHAHTHTHTHCL